MTLRMSTTDEQPLQASKWLKAAALLDIGEMQNLFENLGSFTLFHCGSITPLNEGQLSNDEFLQHYQFYIETLKSGILPEPGSYQKWFSPVMTAATEALFAIPVSGDKQLIRIAKPVIQLQAHNLDFSPLDKKFRSMVFGADNIPWGIQFSFPQIYQDHTTKNIEQVRHSPDASNAALFQNLQKWMRQQTIPTPFIVEDTLYNVPMRLGKQCLAWINRHPQLVKKGITVKTK